MKKIRGQIVYTIKQRLERISSLNKQNGCLECRSVKDGSYYRMVIGSRSDGTRRTVSAHKLAHETYIGPVPDGMYVCHKCDNRRCINPEHLFLGTAKDNAVDMTNKKRNKPPCLKGEDHPNAKLTWDDVNEIRSAINVSRKELSKKYNINVRTVSDIIRFIRWIPPAPEGD